MAAPTIDPAVRTALDADGCVVLDGLLDPAELAGVRAAVEAALDRAGPRSPGGTLHADDLRGPAVEALWAAPRLLAAVEHVLGPDPQRRAMGLRAPYPGFGAQALHADAAGPPPPDGAHVAVAIVALVDVTEDGGATRVVPGTHRWRRVAPGDTVDRRHPDERLVPLRAGSALLLDGHLWHSGTRNRGRYRRDALQVSFTRRGAPP